MKDPLKIAAEGLELAGRAALPIHKRAGGYCGSRTYHISPQFTDSGGMSGEAADYIIHTYFELEAAESRSARYREALARLADAAKTQASITHPEADILTPILDEFADVLKTLESP
jgi:hypothetical protein